MDKPLISVLVVCYNNQQFIYECLHSIFLQTYPRIEVLIGDDGSSDFNGERLISWINGNVTPNVEKIAVFHNEENLGTVANLEKLQEKSSGEYLFNIAADDALFDGTVLDNMFACAQKRGADFVISDTEMWDHELRKRLDSFIKPDTIELIENGSARDLFAACAEKCILPACFLYRKSLLNKVGKLSNTYRLVEDWPTNLRLLAQGIKPVYDGTTPSIKHRDGGISHGNSLQSKKTFLIYYNDIINLYANEIEPHLDLLTDDEKKRIKTIFDDRVRAYYKIHVPEYYKCCEGNLDAAIKELKAAEKAGHVLPTKANTVQQVMEMSKVYSKREKLKKYAYMLSRKKVVIASVLLMFLCFITGGVLGIPATGFANMLSICMMLAGCLSAVYAAGAVCVNILLRMRQRRHG
ncbi:MAG: glycosyltransferase [Eubacteriales bacterium]|nr:glycosyltransferase [Eubacteriales bacterium]